MQTFLPFPSFLASAAALDDRRLGKQRVEAFQILRALVFPVYGWKNHPAVAMWRGFTPALVGYGLAVCREWELRGRADAVAGALLEFTGGQVPDLPALRTEGRLPPWLGEEAVHASHRAALLRKEPAYYGEQFTGRLAVNAEEPYTWPRPLFPRWPVRRGGALPVAEAVAATGLDAECVAAVAPAMAAARAGTPVLLASAELALAAVLGLDPPGLWLAQAPDVRPDAAAPSAPVQATARPPGKLSPSIARPPTPQDAAAMALEARADVGIVVHPLERLADPDVAARLAAAPPSVGVAPAADGWVLHPDWSQLVPPRPASSAARAPSRRRSGGSPAGSTLHPPPRRPGTAGRS